MDALRLPDSDTSTMILETRVSLAFLVTAIFRTPLMFRVPA